MLLISVKGGALAVPAKNVNNPSPPACWVCDWFANGGPSGFDVSEVVLLNDPPVPDDQFGYKGGQVCDKCNDYYKIEIYCGDGRPAAEGGTPKGDPIYTFADYIDGGNFQIHPETGEQCTADLFEPADVTEPDPVRGNKGKKK